MAHTCCTAVVGRAAPPELADVLEVPRGGGGGGAEAGQQLQLERCAAEAGAAGTDIARKRHRRLKGGWLKGAFFFFFCGLSTAVGVGDVRTRAPSAWALRVGLHTAQAGEWQACRF